ncbi:MAG: glycosyl-4,4'-diaponeurosporenoate acyltransferase [Alkalibacterium sp.]
MRLFLLDFGAWLFFHLTISLGLIKLPDRFFSIDHELNQLFKERGFEDKGKFWKEKLSVHKWKDKLPDGASLFNAGYKKKELTSSHISTIETFIKETKRAELTHWLLIVPAPLFFLWNPVWAGWLMIFYALLVNVPFIIIQRYNRIRLDRIKKEKNEKNERMTDNK